MTEGIDIKKVMQIIEEAQAYFKAQGINQWQNGYPSEETIEEDIVNQHSYVLVKDGKIVGTVAICLGPDPNYNKIYEGQWLSEEAYIAIHRIAIANQYKGSGLSSIIIEEVEKICLEGGIYNIRVDTHRENKSMQRLLEKNGFEYCGIIYVADGSERVAFEKEIKNK